MPESVAESFARRLREEREKVGISQTALAHRLSERLGVTIYSTAVTKMENGSRAIKIEEAVAVAEIFDVSLISLVTERDPVDARLEELRRELGRQQARLDEAQNEYQQAMVAMAHIEQEIEHLEASRGD